MVRICEENWRSEMIYENIGSKGKMITRSRRSQKDDMNETMAGSDLQEDMYYNKSEWKLKMEKLRKLQKSL